jgi:hypothetical protein
VIGGATGLIARFLERTGGICRQFIALLGQDAVNGGRNRRFLRFQGFDRCKARQLDRRRVRARYFKNTLHDVTLRRLHAPQLCSQRAEFIVARLRSRRARRFLIRSADRDQVYRRRDGYWR